MSDDASAGFGKFVPGFDFLQNLAKGAAKSLPQMPTLGGWVAPTLNVEDLDKRIGELKAVQFWLDQNATALKATIQALEVQKMTLATLEGMNVSMSEVAKAFTAAPQAAAAAVRPAPRREEPPAPPPAPVAAEEGAEAEDAKPSAGVIDAMQWWGALTQQFQQIAASAVQEAAARARPETPAATTAAAAKPAKRPAAKAPAKAPARKRAG